jgi:hypothetical protein
LRSHRQIGSAGGTEWSIQKRLFFEFFQHAIPSIAEFRRNPKDLVEMSFFFAANVRLKHPDDKRTLEELNQAAAQISREAGN